MSSTSELEVEPGFRLTISFGCGACTQVPLNDRAMARQGTEDGPDVQDLGTRGVDSCGSRRWTAWNQLVNPWNMAQCFQLLTIVTLLNSGVSFGNFGRRENAGFGLQNQVFVAINIISRSSLALSEPQKLEK